MKELISLYDNVLIYYPNVFFPVLFFLGIILIIFVIKGIVFLSKGTVLVIREIKRELKNRVKQRKKQVKIKQKERISFIQVIEDIFKKNKAPFLRNAKITFFRICTTSIFITSKIEKIIKKIKKEILIEK